MNKHDEIARVAYEPYEKSGRMDGSDMKNWVDAERIVNNQHSNDDLTTKVKQIEEKADGMIPAANEVVSVILRELSAFTKKFFK